MSKIYVGIDNGLDGGLVGIDNTGKIWKKTIMPTIGGEHDSKREYDLQEVIQFFNSPDVEKSDFLVVLERAQSFPLQGVASTFATGKGYGLMQGLLTGLGIAYTIVGPKTWQNEILKDLNRTDTKMASGIFVSRMWPQEDWRKSERSRKIHDGLSDAACMAMYAKNHNYF